MPSAMFMDFPSLEGHTLMKFKHFAAEDIGNIPEAVSKPR